MPVIASCQPAALQRWTAYFRPTNWTAYSFMPRMTNRSRTGCEARAPISACPFQVTTFSTPLPRMPSASLKAWPTIGCPCASSISTDDVGGVAGAPGVG